jgi:hypothetical protein
MINKSAFIARAQLLKKMGLKMTNNFLNVWPVVNIF